MSELFLKIVNMSISASYLVLAVLLLRLILKKAPKWVSVFLWGIVAVRLICPVSVESMLSLIPSAQTISPEIMMDATPQIQIGIQSLNTVINPILTQTFAPQPAASANPLQIWIPIAAVLWLAGVVGMLIYTAISFLLLRQKVATAVRLEDNIFQSENVVSPFVLGIICPKIYLPFQMDEQNIAYVIAHERSHIRRKDHWWKPFGFLLLALHWFNPLMWLAYIALCRDIELACDEKVVQEMDNDHRADYTQALVACSVGRRSIAACPLAFGEVGVKARVKSILHYKKPAFWIILVSVVLCVIVAMCFLTDPLTGDGQEYPDPQSVPYPWVQEYVPGTDGIMGNVDTGKYLAVSADFAIGADERGMAVFKDPYKAFATFRKLYAKGIDAIQTQYDLKTISPTNYSLYKIYGWQTDTGSKKAQEQAKFVTGFLDIYENSFTDEDSPRSAEIVETIVTELKTYYALSDGTWRADGRNYWYRLEIKGRMPNAAEDSTFVYLSNLPEITFEQAWKAAGLSSNLEDYFSPEDALLVSFGQEQTVNHFVATILELNKTTALVTPVTEPNNQITFSIAELEDIGVKPGSSVQVYFTGDIMETYPAQIKAVKWEIAKDLRPGSYVGLWLDPKTTEACEDDIFDHIVITEIYSNCFFATPAVPIPWTIKLNGQLSDYWCVGDQVVCTYTNTCRDSENNRYEADLLTIKESDWTPEPGVAYKPVIYLYPEEETQISVKLNLDGKLTCTYPAYDTGWEVTAAPDGTLTDKLGQTYNYLYWEGELNARWDMTEGFCVKGKDTAAFLEQALEKLGLNRKEANEFIVYWLPLMEQNPYNVIAFQTDVYTEGAALEVTPAPDTVIRVFMTWRASENYVNLKMQNLTAPIRTGFTVVEWGGTEIQ